LLKMLKYFATYVKAHKAQVLNMPYIPKLSRLICQKEVEALIAKLQTCDDYEAMCKQTTYAFFKIVRDLYANKGFYIMGDVDKILAAVKGQFDARFVLPHEHNVLDTNGDV
jgi:hypothetical protein